ncbi:sushi, von Willebrand factor type A, EGF and pentraxin domain-containing protein 1 isoform X2 [Penaeus vannamei]|uniref:sushi, von Willebrand factor type A, EGF and pentraxin domain-containing protein 1 isoform X2 n=1 Tax=Penaeus vannamei TaxID=6689 RepID=UPI00387F688B
MDIPGYQYCQSLHSSLDILPEGEFSVNPSERQTKAKYAVCKHQGILDCWSAPESPRKHTTLSWNNSMDYETPAIYQCDEGYYFKGATARRKKTVWCNGQFSNWYPPVASCVIVGCHKDPPDTPKSLTRTLSENYKSDNGTVTYTCPARMVTLKNATNQTVTCRKLRTRYRFSPLRVSDCPACAGKPEVANAWTTWDNETMYEVGSAVVAMCRRDHYVRWRERKQKVQCTESGWQEVPGCVLMRSCDGELPDSDLEPVLSHEFPREGTWATYVCPPTMGSSEDGAEEEVIRCTETPEGMQLLPEVTHPCWRCMAEPTIPNAQTDWQGSVHYLVNSSVTATCSPGRFHAEGKSRLVTCLSTGWEAADGCEPGCSSEPPEGEGDVTREEFTDRRVGARVYYHCSSENFFKSFGYRATYKTAVECQEDGEWHLTDAELKCETVVWQEPPSLNGTVSNLPNWSIFLGTTIEYRCLEGLFSVTGAASTNATAILGGWTDFDPDFRCVPACLKEPEVRNAELAWDSEALYLLDAHVTATCNEGHLSDGGEASRVVTCTAYGWEAISGCYVACTAAPPPAGENMVMGQYNFTGVGASVQYECAQDFYVKRQGEPVSNTSAVCGEDLTWHLSHGSLDCDMPLWIDPPPPLEGVTLQGLQPPFYAGLSYNMTCAEGLSSATGVAFTTVVIASEGWVYQDPDFFCAPACLSEPHVQNAIADWNTTAIYLEGTFVSATCDPGHLAEGDAASLLLSCTNSSWEAVAAASGCHKACVAEPPPPGDRMLRRNHSWSGVGASVLYECLPGYFLRQDGNLTNSTLVVCGSDQSWQLTDEVLTCDTPILSLPDAPLGTDMHVPPGLLWPGTPINCTCQDGLFGVTGANWTAMTATPDGWTLRDPGFFCANACLGEPLVENAVADWSEDAVYVESVAINVTCTDGHFAPGDVPTQVVTCRGDGWEEAERCYAACTAEPPAAGKNVLPRRYSHAVGAFFRYRCAQGFFLRQPGELKTYSIAICGQDRRWWITERSLTCDTPVSTPPPPVPEGAQLQLPAPPFWPGMAVNYTCEDGFVGSTGAAFAVMTVSQQGWRLQDPAFACIPGTYDPPPRPPYGAITDAPAPPYPVGTIVIYRCENGTTFAGGRKVSRVELTEGGWSRLDEDFLCYSRELGGVCLLGGGRGRGDRF